MRKIIYLFLLFTVTKSFGQNECKTCDSLQQLKRQTGNRQAFDEYKSVCLKNDTIFSNTTFVVITKAICSDFTSYLTFNNESSVPTAGFQIEKNDTIFYLADKIPVFKKNGGDVIEFITKKIIYPPNCINKSIQGKVYITFVIDENGNMIDVYPLISPDPDLTKEAIRVVKLLNSWTPGEVNGRPVKFQYNVPIIFRL